MLNVPAHPALHGIELSWMEPPGLGRADPKSLSLGGVISKPVVEGTSSPSQEGRAELTGEIGVPPPGNVAIQPRTCPSDPRTKASPGDTLKVPSLEGTLISLHD